MLARGEAALDPGCLSLELPDPTLDGVAVAWPAHGLRATASSCVQAIRRSATMPRVTQCSCRIRDRQATYVISPRQSIVNPDGSVDRESGSSETNDRPEVAVLLTIAGVSHFYLLPAAILLLRLFMRGLSAKAVSFGFVQPVSQIMSHVRVLDVGRQASSKRLKKVSRLIRWHVWNVVPLTGKFCRAALSFWLFNGPQPLPSVRVRAMGLRQVHHTSLSMNRRKSCMAINVEHFRPEICLGEYSFISRARAGGSAALRSSFLKYTTQRRRAPLHHLLAIVTPN
ncbi:hypothetical protein B0T26DRAFT_726851 [Lasiosphaeria miniovina]|uniref:Uncharacterized protein n=1 Tax=Lasiosphaeria miniovina TaxID=1954250 RepID=A0AA39ZZG0_9PEZI|nr:uncharacterized protein B0T26DRAFT_726851 [Lasiosphaeria miniovina]KAK0706498.1 hypothetical protein B0T26DRAFT_726851 [Lasiosphaeria miniovina]